MNLILYSTLHFIMSLIFLSTSLQKAKNFKEHIKTLAEYQLIPHKAVKYVGLIEILLEFFIGIFLLGGVFIQIVSTIAILLLVIYSFAIAVNILRNQHDLSCGCGGFLGDQKISWSLVFRNSLFIIIFIYLFGFRTSSLSIFELVQSSTLTDLFYPLLTSVLVILSYRNFSLLMEISKIGKG